MTFGEEGFLEMPPSIPGLKAGTCELGLLRLIQSARAPSVLEMADARRVYKLTHLELIVALRSRRSRQGADLGNRICRIRSHEERSYSVLELCIPSNMCAFTARCLDVSDSQSVILCLSVLTTLVVWYLYR